MIASNIKLRIILVHAHRANILNKVCKLLDMAHLSSISNKDTLSPENKAYE